MNKIERNASPIQIDYTLMATRTILNCIFLVVLLCSCGSEPIRTDANNLKVEILIRGPGNCIQLISFDKKGKGSATRGITDDYYHDDFKTFKSIELRCNFMVTSESDLSNINAIVDYINASKVLKGAIKKDARRMELFINDEEKVDIYSNGSSNVDQILATLSSYIPYNIYEYCSLKDGKRIFFKVFVGSRQV